MEWSFKQEATSKEFNLEELTWAQAKKNIQDVNPKLCEIIDLLEPEKKKLTLIKARYPYGASIIDNATLHLPHKSGRSIPIQNADIEESIKKKLSYSPIPLSLPLNKLSEVFLKTNTGVVPLKIISPGWLFGLFEVTSLLCGASINSLWSVSSGARSVFMLPKIADKVGYTRLKKELNISLHSPQSLADHWQIFSTISSHILYINQWFSEIIFFTKDWFTEVPTNPIWAVFYNYLFRESNLQNRFNRDDIAFNVTWQNFVYAIVNRNLRPRPYILDTLKHLVAIGAGMQPGFCTADISEIALPTKLLQDIYVNIYNIKHYLPTIMHPHILMPGQENRPVYYSLAYPVLHEGLPFFKANPDVISDVREVKFLFDTLDSAIQQGKVNLTTAYNLLDKRTYEFFHSNTDIFNEIKASKDMPQKDKLLVTDKTQYPNREFCATGPFLSGCIRISASSNE